MKTYSIGREGGCNIVINDPTDVISRRHALLTVESTGKMTITDQSHNGTYVNGIRISSNVPVPVTRKDNISFAQIAKLDWKLVPDPTAIYKYSIAGVLGVILLGLLIWGCIALFNHGSNNDPVIEPPIIETPKEDPEELERKEKARQDSIREAAQDSIRRANASRPTPPTRKVVTGATKKEKPAEPSEPSEPVTIR